MRLEIVVVECCYSLCNILLDGWTEAGLGFFVIYLLRRARGFWYFRYFVSRRLCLD